LGKAIFDTLELILNICRRPRDYEKRRNIKGLEVFEKILKTSFWSQDPVILPTILA